MTAGTRPPAVAGTFYPADPATLRREVEALLDTAAAPPPDAPRPRALIAPHAGHVYSGGVAATAWRRARGGPWRRVLLVGPAHRCPCRGLALPRVTAMATPLGAVPLDGAGVADLCRLPGIGQDPAAHAEEHSLEVQLPFLQVCLPGAAVLPLLVGDGDAALVTAAIDAVWDGDTLVVASTDLSHFEDQATAVAHDRRTCAAIVAGRDTDLRPRDACGRVAVAGLLRAAAGRGYAAELLDHRTSGDTAGPRDRVVGYAAFTVG